MPITRHGYAERTRNGSTRAWRKLRAQVIASASHCGICHQPLTYLDKVEADHITPVAHGGTDAPTNLRAVHRTCNRRRGVGYEG